MRAISSRRDFLKATATTTAAATALTLFQGTLCAKENTRGVAIILSPQDAKEKPAQWVAAELHDALKSRGVAVEIFDSLEQTPAGFDCIIAATAGSSVGKAGACCYWLFHCPTVPEAVGLAHGKLGNRRFLLGHGIGCARACLCGSGTGGPRELRRRSRSMN
jgi:hypothetical protein